MSARYVDVGAEEFAALMRDCGFEEIAPARSYEERQWQRPLPMTAGGEAVESDLAVRVYSSLAPGSGTARKVGADAIRVVLVHAATGRPVWSATRVHRTQGWAERTRERMREAWRAAWQAPRCPDCRAPMVMRESRSSGSFFGCVTYPTCRGTRSAPRGAAGG